MSEDLAVREIKDIEEQIKELKENIKRERNELHEWKISKCEPNLNKLPEKKEKLKKKTFFQGNLNENKKIDGFGRFHYANGDVLTGEFKNETIHGYGILSYHKKSKEEEYEGSWNNAKKEGLGFLKFRNGNRYEGNFKNDLPHGFGIFYKKEEGIREEGYFKEVKFMDGETFFEKPEVLE